MSDAARRPGRFPAWAGAGLLALALAAGASPARAQSLDGDTGIGLTGGRSAIRGVPSTVSAIPFVYADYGRAFVRVDTLGVRTVDLGRGSLEFALRVSQDGWKTEDDPALAGLAERRAPVLFGLGTLQRTPYGAIFAHAYHDVARSKGTLVQLSYVARFGLGPVIGYPYAALDWRDARYNRYVVGVSDAEAAQHPAALRPYQPGDAFIPRLGLLLDWPLSGPWHLLTTASVKSLPGAVTGSPLVHRSTESSLTGAVVYRWK